MIPMKILCCSALLGAGLLALAALAPSSALAKTTRECAADWAANKATLQAGGKTRRAYIAECRGVDQAARPPRKSANIGKAQFATEAEAKTSCPGDAVVWVNLRSRVYHASDSASYGKTKRGAYMCEKETSAAGYRASKAKRAAGAQ
jgi:hypothetical protein